MTIEDRLRDHLHAKAEMVEVPDEPFTEASPRRPLPRLTPVAVAAAVVALVGGFALLIGRFQTQTVEPTAASVADIVAEDAVRAPGIAGDTYLSWSRVDMPADVQRITDIAATPDGYIAVGDAASSVSISHAAPVLLESADGVSWRTASADAPLPDQGGLLAVAAEDDTVVIAGLEPLGPAPDERILGFAGVDSQAVLYTSSDGEWRRIALEEPDHPYTFVTPNTYVHGLAISDGTTLVLATEFWEPDLVGMAAAVGQEVDPASILSFGFDYDLLEIQGQGNATMARVRISDLGVSAEEQALLTTPLGGRRLWVSDDFEAFDEVHVEGLDAQVFVESAGVLADGRFYITGQGQRGGSVWVSADGRSWERLLSQTALTRSAVPFGDEWFAASNAWPQADIRASAGGDFWFEATPEGLFPTDDGLRWNVWDVQAGEIGVVATARGTAATSSFSGSPVVEITKDGYDITLRPDTGIATVAADGETLLSILDYRVDSEKSRFLPATGDVEFLDPDSGDVLVTLTGEEIAEGERALFEPPEPGDEPAAILYSPDGFEWSFQRVEDAIGAGLSGGGMNLLVVDDKLVLGTVHHWDGPPGLGRAPRTELWVGTPDG